MRKRRWMICAALVCLAMACGGCADKKKEANTAVIEGDDIKEYSSGTDTSGDTEKDADLWIRCPVWMQSLPIS